MGCRLANLANQGMSRTRQRFASVQLDRSTRTDLSLSMISLSPAAGPRTETSAQSNTSIASDPQLPELGQASLGLTSTPRNSNTDVSSLFACPRPGNVLPQSSSTKVSHSESSGKQSETRTISPSRSTKQAECEHFRLQVTSRSARTRSWQWTNKTTGEEQGSHEATNQQTDRQGSKGI